MGFHCSDARCYSQRLEAKAVRSLTEALEAHLAREELRLQMRDDQIAMLAQRITKIEHALTNTPAPKPEPEPVEPPAWTGPITVTRGGEYHGAWHSNSTTPAITINTNEPVTITGAARGHGHLIHAPGNQNQHITLNNLTLTSLGPGRALQADRINTLTMRHCDLVNTDGVYIHESSGATIIIEHNRATNIGHHQSNARPYVQFVQFDKTKNARGRIAWNAVTNEPHQSRAEDVINFFASGGTSDTPYVIEHNLIHGAYPREPLTSTYSGGGILVGDYGHGHVLVTRNTVLDTVNYGIAIAGGYGSRLEHNIVLGINTVDGERARGANIGAYIWHQQGDPGPTGANTGSGNTIGWWNKGDRRNDWWTPDAANWSGNTAAREVTREAVLAARAAWLIAARGAGFPW